MLKTLYFMFTAAALTFMSNPAIAQDSTQPFNLEAVEQLSQEDQDRIIMILRGAKLLEEDENLEVLANQPPPEQLDFFDDVGDFIDDINPVKVICQTACDALAVTAAGACSGSTVGVGLAACLAAAETGRQYCRSRC